MTDDIVQWLPSDPTAPAWLVLQHAAGPATPPDGVFSSPGFRLHLAFLSSLAESGVLVAAGSLPDDSGAGMTIVRARGSAEALRITRAAHEEDGAVQAGLLTVRVRPWNVAMSAPALTPSDGG